MSGCLPSIHLSNHPSIPWKDFCSQPSPAQSLTLRNAKPSLFLVMCRAFCSWRQFHHFSPFFPPPKLWEQVAAVNRRDPLPEVVAAEDHRIHVLCNILQPQRVLDRWVHFTAAPDGGTQAKQNIVPFRGTFYFIFFSKENSCRILSAAWKWGKSDLVQIDYETKLVIHL